MWLSCDYHNRFCMQVGMRIGVTTTSSVLALLVSSGVYNVIQSRRNCNVFILLFLKVGCILVSIKIALRKWDKWLFGGTSFWVQFLACAGGSGWIKAQPAHLLAQPYKVSYSCRLTFVTLSQRSGPYDGLNPRMSIACMDVCKLDMFVVFVYSLWKTSCILITWINLD